VGDARTRNARQRTAGAEGAAQGKGLVQMKKNTAILTAIGIAAGASLAIVIAPRLSNEALAVVVGAICGLSSAIPVTIGLVIAVSCSRQDDQTIPLQTFIVEKYQHTQLITAPEPKLLANTCEHGVPIAPGFYCGSCAGGRREPRMLNA
jgi:hypothetical protein